MAMHLALLSRNLIGWSSGRIEPSCCINSAAKRNWQRTLTKILRKLRKVIKLGEKAFHKTRERLFLGKFSVSFRSIFGKFENQQKTLGKWFWTSFVEQYFFRQLSANFRWMFGIFSFFLCNKLFINRIPRAVPWNTKPSFFTHGHRKLGPYFKTSG